MDDCFDTIDEPLYGFRTKVTSEKTCGVFGTSCDITKAIKESILQERQTGGEFRSLAPKDCAESWRCYMLNPLRNKTSSNIKVHRKNTSCNQKF